MNTDIEVYREFTIIGTDTRGHKGFAAIRPGGGNGVGDLVARGRPNIEAVRAKIDQILDTPRPERP